MKQPLPVFEGDIVDSKLKLSEREKESMRRWCATFKNGTHVDITIKKHRSQRSSDQNAYYWGVVIPILADYFGHDNPEDMHEDLKLKFNPVKSKIDSDKIIGGSTAKMSTEEFFCYETSYVERICRWASMEYGVYIPPPQKREARKE